MLVGNGPQYISSIRIVVHNTLVNTEVSIVQYGKRSTIHKFNMEKGPQYVSWKWSTIYQFNTDCGPQ